ncbi:hypothetical protein ACIBMZ_26540 [Micromonospora sp. NPDC049900]|uniref:hypothetical protein n=1 Tax=Micromonospora sp. NPDC049900 TaxID=3364275 RepID=UPI00378996B4
MLSSSADFPALPERIAGIAQGWWECLCGNEPHMYGFTPSDADGRPVEPTSHGWDGQTNVCTSCGRIFSQDTGFVIGRRHTPFSDDER